MVAPDRATARLEDEITWKIQAPAVVANFFLTSFQFLMLISFSALSKRLSYLNKYIILLLF